MEIDIGIACLVKTRSVFLFFKSQDGFLSAFQSGTRLFLHGGHQFRHFHHRIAGNALRVLPGSRHGLHNHRIDGGGTVIIEDGITDARFGVQFLKDVITASGITRDASVIVIIAQTALIHLYIYRFIPDIAYVYVSASSGKPFIPVHIDFHIAVVAYRIAHQLNPVFVHVYRETGRTSGFRLYVNAVIRSPYRKAHLAFLGRQASGVIRLCHNVIVCTGSEQNRQK